MPTDTASPAPAGTSTADAPPLHGSFALGIDLAAEPTGVYAAFADPELRGRWVRLPGHADERRLDFRPGGGEWLAATFAHGESSERIERRTSFVDLVPGRRLLFGYDVVIDGRRCWASLVTVLLTARSGGTRLDWTEQYTYLEYAGDGATDVAHLRGGTRLHLNALAALVEPPRRPLAGGSVLS